MLIEPEVSGASVVIVGNFNPAIFHPTWLVQHGIEEAVPDELIKLDVCHNDISKFSIAGSLYFVDQQRFQLQTSSAPWIGVLDKVSRLFSDLLPHTPAKAFGINRDVHFRVGSFERRMRIGRVLAPVDPWGAFGKEMAGDDKDPSGGLMSLTMRASEEMDAYSLSKNVKVEPSGQLDGVDGIYMQANFHFSLKDEKVVMSNIVDVAQHEFQNRVNEAEEIFDTIMGIE